MAKVICPNCNEEINISYIEDNYTCPFCENEFDGEEADLITDEDDYDVEEAIPTNNSGGIVGVIFLVVICILMYNWLFKPKWTLFVCSTLLYDDYKYECEENALVELNEYKNLSECSLQGQRYLSQYPGYECGKKCKYDTDWGTYICKITGEF